MTDVTQILAKIEHGDPSAADQLLPLVYNELRKLAAAKLAHEKPGQTLQATALVHEAYIRLLGGNADQDWDSRGHFFAAAAEAMRRILVDQARRKGSQRAGGDRKRIELSAVGPEVSGKPVDLLALDEAIAQLEQHDSRSCEVVKLRFFAGLTIPQAADALGVSVSTAENDWAYARSWLKRRLQDTSDTE
jgi:RNA polymerase sigma factor (TIGR02999 family)